MARAGEVLAGATLTVEDDRRDYGEDRFITIGFLEDTMVVLVWTPRDGSQRIESQWTRANALRPQILIGTRLRTSPGTAGRTKFARAAVHRGRPPIARPRVSTTIRLSPDVIDHFKAGGRGWQTRINDALLEWIAGREAGAP